MENGYSPGKFSRSKREQLLERKTEQPVLLRRGTSSNAALLRLHVYVSKFGLKPMYHP